jgi:hypothetical protein
VGFRRRESGTRVMRFGAERREAVQGMRRKGSLESEGAMVDLFSPGRSVFERVAVFFPVESGFRDVQLWNCGVGGFAGLPVSVMEFCR